MDRKTGPAVLALAILALACSCGTSPTGPNGDSHLTIRTTLTAYSWSDNSFADSRTVLAEISNSSSATYYARLGDRFSNSLDQKLLFVAEGSDGHLGRISSEISWEAMPRSMLIEGVGFVKLRPDTHYDLLVLLPGDDRPSGTVAIRIDYYDQLDAAEGAASFSDYSTTFQIK